MLLENTTLGYELLIHYPATAINIGIILAKSGNFTAGTGNNTTNPTPSSPVQGIALGQGTISAGGESPIGFWGNSTGGFIGSVMYFHFTVADTGEFHFETSMQGYNPTAGTYPFLQFVAVWKTTGQQTGDTNNCFLFFDALTTTRGVCQGARIVLSAFAACTTPSNVQQIIGGIAVADTGNVLPLNVYGTDALSGNFLSWPCDFYGVTPQLCRRGSFPDIYLISAAAVASSVPSTSSQIRIVIGDMVWPFISVVPLM
jgi:hypothetical protein